MYSKPSAGDLCLSPHDRPPVSLRPEHWLSNVISNQWSQYCCIAIATLIKQLKYIITIPMKVQPFEATALCCFQSLPQKVIKSAIDKMGFQQQDLTSVIFCSSAVVLQTTPRPPIMAWEEALVQPAVTGQGFVLSSKTTLFSPLLNSQSVCIFSLSLPFRAVSISC